MDKTMSLVKTNVGCVGVKRCSLRSEPICSGILVNRELTTLSAVVKDYKRYHRKKAQMELGVFERYTSFVVVLKKAGSARSPCDKKYSLQR